MGDIRVGLVGLGCAGDAHVQAFKSVTGANVTAICSRRSHVPADVEARYGIPLKIYTDYDAMASDPEIDAIDICTPHSQHAEQALTAARAGKHLLIEKPVSIRWEDAQQLKEAIADAGVVSCVCFEARFSAHLRLIHSVIQQGLLGEIHYAEVDYFHGIGPSNPQFGWNARKDMGGSSLLTAGCHAMDALLWFMNDVAEEVTSYQTTSKNPMFEPYEYNTTSTSIVRFKSGKVGKCTSVIDCLQPYYFHIHIVGSEGSLLDNKFYSRKLQGLDEGRWSTLATDLIDSGDVKDHPYQLQFQQFADAIKNGTEMPLTDFDTAFETHRVVFAADLSARQSRPVKLSEFGSMPVATVR